MSGPSDGRADGAAATGVSAPSVLPANAALLIDLDGTLLDIALTPDSVVVPPGLPATLARLNERLSGAVAVVTGRPVAQVDALLGGVVTAVAGEHGATIRHHPDGPIERGVLTDLPPDWLAHAAQLAGSIDGVLLETKSHSFVLHYRLAPEAGPVLYDSMQRMLEGHADRFTIMAARMAWEMKPLGADKGTAVISLMSRPPFAGRVPIFIGDDTTDEFGMAVARTMDGLGLKVQDVFTDPAGVRAWLARMAEGR